MLKKIIIFYLIIINVSALNDINVSIDSGSVELCLAEKTLNNMTCNLTSYLTLSGSSDHFIYFTSPKLYDNFDRDTDNKWQWVSNEFFDYIDFFIDIVYFVIPILIYLGGVLVALYIVYRFIISNF